ncbi:MAG: ABC transporter permease [Planctomycetes bacterium]|nr:ABC transporter permease [Planctomycetota bacterium]
MAYLPLANIMHYRLRSALSALGIGFGICMLVTLTGLSRGSLGEIADRWEAVDADLIVYPAAWGDNITTMNGLGLSDKYAARLAADHPQLIGRVVPVFLWQIKLGGQDQTAAGVDSGQWQHLTGGRPLSQGRLFDPQGQFARWLEQKLTAQADTQAADDKPVEIAEKDLSDPQHNGLEIVIDERLARSGHYSLDQVVEFANHHWRIVGIVPDGAMTRVFMPRRAAQFLFGSGSIQKSTLMFVKLRPGADHDAAARKIRTPILEVVQVRQYRAMLERKFGVLYGYVDAVNVIALAISFLFIMVTLYMMVLQRTREIAILKSCGASRLFIMRQVLAESAILTAAGTIVGIALTAPAAWAICRFKPLLTVKITWEWIAVAVAVAVVGSIFSGLYPAWRATRVDMVEALAIE